MTEVLDSSGYPMIASFPAQEDYMIVDCVKLGNMVVPIAEEDQCLHNGYKNVSYEVLTHVSVVRVKNDQTIKGLVAWSTGPKVTRGSSSPRYSEISLSCIC